MSKPSASPSPLAAAISPAPTAPPAGPLSTLQAPPLAASEASATPPEDCMTIGAGTPSSAQRSARRTEVAAEQRREICVEDRRRAPFVLTEEGKHLR